MAALMTVGMRSAQQAAPNKTRVSPPAAAWISVSDDLLKQLMAGGKKIAPPGGTTGVCVDRATGDVSIVVADQGVWRRSPGGTGFTRLDGGSITGHCETGSALNTDPAGQRIACFMLDGQSGMTVDNGKTWSVFQGHGRGWDFGAVDWSRILIRDILAVSHESGGELYRSVDAGKSWQLLGKGFTAVGVFDLNAYVATRGDGILRSADGGATWKKVSDITPTGRVLCVVKGVGYWLTTTGLLVSTDRGKTWQQQGSALEAAWGPFFGKDEKEIVVAARRDKVEGLWKTEDAGTTWKRVAPFPQFTGERPDWTPSKYWAAGWFFNFGWDWKNDTLYASRMGNPTVAYKRP